MKRLILFLFIILHPVLRAQHRFDSTAGPDFTWGEDETVVFTPIYGRDTEMNDLLTFITNWVVVRIPYNEEMHKVNEVIRCRFIMDTTGKIIYVKIHKNR